MLRAVGTTQQGDVGLINNIKSRVKGNFQAQLAPNDFGVPLERDGELKTRLPLFATSGLWLFVCNKEICNPTITYYGFLLTKLSFLR